MRAVAGIGADRSEHVEEGSVVLPVLLCEIADGRREIAPGGRRVGELRHVGAVPERKRLVRLPPARDGRKLEEIADQHDLHPAEWRRHAFDVAAERIDQREAMRRQHRDLVDD